MMSATENDQENISPVHTFNSSQDGLLSPPPSSPILPPATASQKMRKPPPITPKRFTRFFTPRNTRGSSTGRSGRILRDITSNRTQIASDAFSNPRPAKKRRISFPDELPSPSSRASSPAPCPSSSPMMPSSPIKHYMGAIRGSIFQERVERASVPAAVPQSQMDVADFCSVPDDMHEFRHQGLPFSVAACKTNTVVAIGTDTGNIHFVESAADGRSSFRTSFLETQPHANAITDMDFSHDDRFLATASGDQTACIVDMYTRETLHVLPEHGSSIKRIAWAPNSERMVTTCSRDGTVGIWDLRYRGRAPVWNAAIRPHPNERDNSVAMLRAIPSAHASGRSNKSHCITSLNFLNTPGREHLFVTSSEGNAQIRLWDIRTSRLSSNGSAVPVSVSGEIEGHKRTRPYGILGLTLSGDRSRIYSACRDGTVYVYSTNHLILGQAPELSAKAPRWSGQGHTGAGPLYGMTNPSLRTNSFYIRCALRPAFADRTELLAIGNSDNSPILMPTDEAAFHTPGAARRLDPILARPTFRPHARLPPHAIGLPSRAHKHHTLPIYSLGAPLVRGHSKEVSIPCWNAAGDLVTISDDFTARVWRQNADVARDLRQGGEGGGRRHMRGWADVDASYDEEDE